MLVVGTFSGVILTHKAMHTSTTIVLAAFILASAWTAEATYECTCDINHPQGYIFDCPSRTRVIGAVYRPDNVFPYHSIDLQGPYCKALLRNVVAPSGFNAVLHNEQIGYLETDSGYSKRSCDGKALFDTVKLRRSANCNHTIIGSLGFNVVQNSPTTTAQPHNTQGWVVVTPSQGWVPVVQKNDIQCKGSTIQDAVDRGLTVFHSKTRICNSHGVSDQESVLLAFCHAPSDLKKWNAGLQVTKHCSLISKYSPITMFDNNLIRNGDGTGIFLQCTKTGGFKMIRQTCRSQKLEVVEVTLNDFADKYFVVY